MENFMRKLVAIGFVMIISVLQMNADCPKPITHENVIVIYPPNLPRTNQLPEKTMITFQCKPGYQYVEGDKTVRCVRGGWVANGEANDLICEIKECPAVKIANGATEVRGNQIKYTCNRGFKLKGVANSECRLNELGNYVAPEPPTCEECPAVKIANGATEVRGNQIKYTCNRGFQLKGVANSQCRLNKQGNYVAPKPPTCEALAECENPKLSGLHFEGNCCYAGDHIKLSCRTGYRLEGTIGMICLSNGHWSSSFPSCKWIQKCEDPGNSSFSIRHGNCCKIGTILTYKCEEGYELVDSDAGNLIKCLPEEKWSGPKPRCKPKGEVVCPDIPLEKNNLLLQGATIEKKDVYVAWDEVYLQCKDGYTTNNPMILTCEGNGQWDVNMPVCIPKNPCLRPFIPDNGIIEELIDNDDSYFPIGFEINILCKENYEIKSGRYGSRCLGDNKWENGISNCTMIECSDPGTPDGAQKDGDDFRLGSSVTYKCLGNLNLHGSETRTCEETRRWSGQTTVCDAGDTYCPDPGKPIHSNRKIEGLNRGDKVIYSCEPGSEMIGNSTRICLEDRTWSEEEVICLGSNEYPSMDGVATALSKTIVQISRQSSYSRPIIGRSTIASDQATGVNVFFLLDASGSITEAEFNKSKELAVYVVRQIGISTHNGGVRISVIKFSDTAKTVVSWAVESVEEAVTLINRIVKIKDEGTNIRNALQQLINAVASTKENENVRDHKNIAFLISDGNSNEGGKLVKEVKAIKKYAIKMYAIAIGKKLDRPTLKIITGDENSIFEFHSYQKFLEIISRSIGNETNFHLCGINKPNIKSNTDDLNKNRRKRFIQNIGRIVGGHEAELSWPWMAALYFKNNSKWQFTCGGSIIHSEWILTAAHCFIVFDEYFIINKDITKQLQDATNWKASVGRLNLSVENTGIFYRISAIKVHQNFDPKSYGNDIALLKMDKSIIFDIYTSPICLPPLMKDICKKSKMYSNNSEAYVVGWGHTKVTDGFLRSPETSEMLLQLMLPLQDEQTCQQEVAYKDGTGRYITPSPNSLCAGTGKDQKDACKGDSGGPLMQFLLSNSNSRIMNRWFEIGIVSWGIGCGLDGRYAYFAHVSKLKQWILKETNYADFEVVTLNG